MQEVTRKPDEKKVGGIVTIQKVVSREVFWHVFCQNPETYKAKCHHRR